MATPTVRKRQLGNELRHLREAAEMSQEDAARVVDKKQNWMARVEGGQSNVTLGDLMLLLKAFGATEPSVVEFFTELRRGNEQRGRWTGFRRSYPEQFRMYIDLEEDCDQLQIVETEVAPSLLQCENYVRAMYADRDLDNIETEERVTARLDRQKILDREDPPQVGFVLSESSLRRSYADPAVMREQINHMVEVSKRPNVQLRVLPFTTRTNMAAAVGYRFILLRIPSPGTAGPLEFVYVEGVEDNRYLDEKQAVVAHTNVWSRMTAAALSPDDSRKFMRKVAREHH